MYDGTATKETKLTNSPKQSKMGIIISYHYRNRECPDAFCIRYTSRTLAESGGDMYDASDPDIKSSLALFAYVLSAYSSIVHQKSHRHFISSSSASSSSQSHPLRPSLHFFSGTIAGNSTGVNAIGGAPSGLFCSRRSCPPISTGAPAPSIPCCCLHCCCCCCNCNCCCCCC
jgi:hypothetical protein